MNSSKPSFLVDVGVGKVIENYLMEAGYDTKSIRDIDPRMEDIEIIHVAISENRMIITMDKDFGELIYHRSINHNGVLLLRLDDAAASEKLQTVKHILQNHQSKIFNCFCVFQNGRLRIRKKRSITRLG